MEDEGIREPSPSLWRRRATRRALLAGTATVAAAGTVAAIVGVSRYGDDDESSSAVSNSGTPGTTPASGQDPSRVISDPRKRAAHLLRRAGFGGTFAEIEEFSKLSREAAADRLLDFETIDNSALNARLASAGVDITTAGYDETGRGGYIGAMQRWWLIRMAYTARPLEERMTLIWHGLLTSQVSKIGGQRAHLMVIQNELFRSHALPVYDDLVKAIGKDPAMMIYLDTVESTKEAPNENYPRELMELFTMGVGNYTEDDVRESARAFTGWRLTPPDRAPVDPNLSEAERRALMQKLYRQYRPSFMLQARNHDNGVKTFLGESGNFDGDQITAIIMKQQATGTYVTRRLFTEFANYNPSDETVARLVEVWESSGHNVRDVVRAILVSDEFYSEASYRGFVRSPVEFLAGAVRALELETDFANIQRSAGGMDQVLFEPPSVAGWPGGSTWLSSSTFFARVNYLDTLLFARQRLTIPPLMEAAVTAHDAVNAALVRLVDDTVTDDSRQSLYQYAESIPNAQERAAAIAYLVLASPEYQLV